MRPLSYAIAFILLATGTSVAGPAIDGLPGVGTFSYNGSPIVTPAPARVAAAEIGH
jgi:hypothetical protein